MQQLHSRKGQGLDVTVTDQNGNVATRTRHTSQEGLIDDAVGRVKAANNGVLTPQGQLDAANEVAWRTANVPMDQHDVNAIRNSAPRNAAKAPAPNVPAPKASAPELPKTASLPQAAKTEQAATTVAQGAKTESTLSQAAKLEQAASKGVQVVKAESTAAKVLAGAAPALKVIGKVAGPVGAALSAHALGEDIAKGVLPRPSAMVPARSPAGSRRSPLRQARSAQAGQPPELPPSPQKLHRSWRQLASELPSERTSTTTLKYRIPPHRPERGWSSTLEVP